MYSLITLLFTFITFCQAIAVGKGLVRIDDQNFGLYQQNIPLNLTDTKISFGFTLIESKSNNESFINPDHVVIALSIPELSSEFYLYPQLLQGKVYESNIFIKDISPYLLQSSNSSIQITIITGDELNNDYNDIINVGTIKPSSKLIADKSQIAKPIRFNERDEVYFTFKEKPRMLPTLVTTQFTFIILILNVVLLLLWNYFDAANAYNFTKYSPLSFLFIISIFIFEYYFIDYFFSASIFQSLYRFSITGICSIYLGSKTLRDMYKLRLSKLR